MIDKIKIEHEFFNALNDYLDDKNERVKTLDVDKRKVLIGIAKEYYQYLADNNISYGRLALEVVNNEGKFGLMANSHLKHQCIFDGIKADKIPEIREQIIISLAYHDMMMRKSSDYNQNNNVAEDIENYHISVFKSLATPYAWGGLAFRELVGTGSWLRLYEQGGSDVNAVTTLFKNYKQSKEYSSTRLMDSIRHTWTHYHDLGGIVKPYVDDVAFAPSLDAVSKAYLAKLYDVSEDRVIEVNAPQSDTPMVSYKHYKILPASDNPINHDQAQHDTTPQVSPKMYELITSFKLPNITGAYQVGYKGIDTRRIPVNYSYISDPSAMNETVRWMLNIHHSTNKGNSEMLNSSNTNKNEGIFYMSLVSPQKTIFYGNNIKEHNTKTTKDINTKSIALSWRQYEEAAEWANRHSNMTQADSNVASIYDKDGRQFIQDLWNFLGKPLYYTVVYSTDELLKLGTKCATDLLRVYGSFDTMKRGQFIDKDLSKELLADRLNIDVDSIVGGGIGYNNTAVVKSFVVNVDQKLVDQARAMLISPVNTPEQCRIVIKHNNITVQSSEALDALVRNKNTKVIDLVRSVLQKYQWDFKDNTLDLTMCRNDQQELKDEYNHHQPSMFYARRDLVENIFNHAHSANNQSFDSYILSGYGEPQKIHMWYVNNILVCLSLTSILGYNIDDQVYDSTTLVNNIIQHWNSKLDLLSTKSELNVSVIPSYDYHTYKLIIDTIYKTLSSPLRFEQSYSTSGPDKAVYYALECPTMNITDDVTNHKHRHYHGEGHYRTSDDTEHMMFSSASSAKPIGYNALNWVKEQIGKIRELTFFNCIELVHRWYKGDENNILDKIVAIKDSNIVSENVSNLDDLIMYTNILSNQDVLALNHMPLLSHEYTQDLVSTTNNAVNILGTLMLANLVVHMMTPVKQRTTVNDISDTHEITVDTQVVDSEHAHRFAYSSYAPVIGENAEDIELVGVV